MNLDKEGRLLPYILISVAVLLFQGQELIGFSLLFSSIAIISALSFTIFALQWIRFSMPSKNKDLEMVLASAAIVALGVLEELIMFSKGYQLSVVSPFFQELFLFSFMAMACILPALLGAIVLRKYRGKAKIIGYILVAFAIGVVCFFCLDNAINVLPNDAIYLSFYASKAMLAGHNPYALNYSGLYNSVQNNTINSLTLTTNGKIVSFFGYPALDLVMTTPFNLLGKTIHGLMYWLVAEEGAFFLVLLAVIVLFGKNLGRSRIIILIVGVSFLFFELISPIDMLGIAFLIAAYFSMKKRYFGSLLALAALTQQLFWAPAILLLAYSIATSKMRKSAYDIATSAATFLLCSSYFILLGPATYFKNIIGLLGGVLPTGQAVFGILLLRYFDIPLHYFTILFAISFAISIMLFLALKEKRNFALFSLVPFMFLDYTRIEYFACFLVLGLVIFAIDKKAQVAKYKNALAKRDLLLLGIAIVALLMVGTVVYGHIIYLKNFDLRVWNASGSQTATNSTYAAQFKSNFAGNGRVILFGLVDNDSGLIAMINDINVSFGSSALGYHSYVINYTGQEPNNTVHIPYVENESGSIVIILNGTKRTWEECGIYTPDYYYICPAVAVK